MKATCSNGHDFEYEETDIKSHFVMCGDSTDKANVELLMNGVKADMVFTDPPYALFGNSTGVSEGVADDKMVRPFFRDIMNMCKLTTKLYGHIYMCCDWHSAFAIEAVARDVELRRKNMCIWYKGQGGIGAMYTMSYEIVWFFANSPINKTTSRTIKGGKERTINGVSNVWVVNRETGEKYHNAIKPIEMIKIPINASSDKNDIVLDLFLGSGSTLIACEQTDRICYGMELDEKYLDVVRKRWAKYVYPDRWEKEWEILTPAIEKL